MTVSLDPRDLVAIDLKSLETLDYKHARLREGDTVAKTKQPSKEDETKVEQPSEAQNEPTPESDKEPEQTIEQQLSEVKLQLVVARDLAAARQEEIEELKADLARVSKEAAASVAAASKTKVEKIEGGTYAVVNGEKVALALEPRPFKDFVDDWRRRNFNEGLLTLVLERY